MIKLLINFFCWLHNFSYKVISFLAIRSNGGIHPKHRILNYHQFFLDNISAGDSVLDIGCGNGAVAQDISKKARCVFGIDLSEENIRGARRNFNCSNIEYVAGDATTYDFNEKFDVIILSNVLEHIENRVEFLQKIQRLAPKILIRVPLLTRDWLAVYKKEIGIEYRLDKTHFLEYAEEDFLKEAKTAGLKVEKYQVRFGELFGIINASPNERF